MMESDEIDVEDYASQIALARQRGTARLDGVKGIPFVSFAKETDSSNNSNLRTVNPDLRAEGDAAGQATVPDARDAPISVWMVAGGLNHHTPVGLRTRGNDGHRLCDPGPC
jgi:hypothetical protein